jgi:DNA-binding NarL/FixJ family response regulator
MFINPFGYTPPEKKPTDPLDTPEERSKLTDITIGEKGQTAAHESAAVLRMMRAGSPGGAIAYLLRCSLRTVQHEIKLGLDLETEAALQGMPIYDSGLPKNAK